MRPPQQRPALTRRRPSEPIRPLPAQKIGISLLAAKAHRRRYRPGPLPKAGERGW